MPTRPKSDPSALVTDARRVLLAAKKFGPQLRAAEKGRKAKLFPGGFDAFVSATSKSIASVENQAGGQSVRTASTKGATASEKAARELLFAQIVSIRDAITLTPGIAKTVAQAFGEGKRIKATSTPILLGTANAIVEAYADVTNRKVAAAAGVTPALVKKCVAARDALAAADASQGAQLSGRKVGTLNKDAAVKALAASIAHLRKVAGSVFRGNTLALTEFKSTLPRHAVKKRASGTKMPAATATTPAKTPTA